MSCRFLKIHDFWSSHWPLLGILVVTVATFWPTFTNGFQMEWDDQWQVINTFTTGENSLIALLFHTQNGYMGQFSPLNQFFYSLLFGIAGYNPLVFHAYSLLLHLCNIVCVYFLLKLLLVEKTLLPKNRIITICTFTSLIFAVHPLQVESVAWISASKIPLFSLFYLLASISLAKYLTTRIFKFYFLTISCFILSYCAKEQAIMFPVWATSLCVLYDLRPNQLTFWKILLPIIILALFFSIHFVFYISSYDFIVKSDAYTWWQRILLFFYSLTMYLMRSVFPVGLKWIYESPFVTGHAFPSWLFYYPIIYSLIAIGLLGHLRNKKVLVAVLFFFIHLLPVMHLTVLPRSAIVADRYIYLPIISLGFIAINAITSPRISTRYNIYLLVSFCIAVAIYSILAYERTLKWYDSTTLKKDLQQQYTNK